MRQYYMSEMNVSDRHGGGLTLQRILGDDLDQFEGFIQLSDFSEKFPSASQYVHKELNPWKEFPRFVKLPMPFYVSADYVINRLKRWAGIPNPKYLDYDYNNIHFSRLLMEKIDFTRSKFLIVPQHHQSILLTNILSAKAPVEYVTWIMDDHMLRYKNGKGFHYPEPLYFEKHFRTFLRKAKQVFVISDNMRKFYHERFGVDSLVLFGPSDAELSFKKMPGGNSSEIRLCYFGAVWKWQEDALKKMSCVLEKLNARVDIFTFHSVNDEITGNPRIAVKAPVPAAQVKDLMRSYDGVVIFYGFNDEVRQLSELNISTKLSECLASRVPTVLVGPEYGAMTQFARKYECAVVLSDVTSQSQIENFKQAFTQEGSRTILKKAKWVAENITSTEAMRKIWRMGWNGHSQ